MNFKRVNTLLGLMALLAAGGIALAAGRGGPATTSPASTPPTTGPAASPTGASTPTAAAKPSDLKLTLMDGSVLAGKLSVSDLAIDTKFGSLRVPVDQIQSFMPGLSSHPQFKQQIVDYVNDLGADLFADREKAQQALMKIGPDIRPELERMAKTAEAEKLNRLQKIIEDFDTMNSDDDNKAMGWATDDVIVTPGFTVVGRITTPGFSVSSNYGTLNLKLEDIRNAAREVAGPEEIRKNFTVNGTAFSQRLYTNTSIKLSKGDQVIVTATGTLTMTPWGNNQVCTPDGGSNFGSVGAGIMGGTLVGKIGDGGPMVKLGSKATFTADRAGVFQLGIASQGDYPSYNFPGEYQVKIRVVKK